MGLRYGGKIVDDYSAMRGPCPEGFHIPMESERQTIRTMWIDLGKPIEFATAFKMPRAGRLYNTSGGFNNYSAAFFRSCKASGNNYQARQFWASTGTPTISSTVRSYGYSIRPFKDTPVVPDSNRTTIYAGTGDAGIFHNSTLGLISVSSDGINWVTISDKNLGATTAYTSGAYNDESNCGGFFQWGNNYMFPRSGATNTSATQVDTTGYGPGNYYNSSTFITSDGAWDNSDNRNLRGGVTGVQQRPAPIVKRYYGGKLVNDYSAMRGPCPDGFHVPMRDEFYAVLDVWTGLGGLDTEGDNFIMALKLPKTGRRLSDASTGSQNSMGYYWGTTRPTGSNAHVMTCRSSKVTVTNNVCAGGLSIRPFKDTPVVPTSSWTKLYGTSIEAGGIFWSSTDGLISLSSDGTNRITIADKNLGATQVWNSGDTLSEANCGKYYQRGNNYGFPRTGTISNTSSTQVDTTGYGPGNYYLDDTFIIGNDDWASPRNANLRGGVTGVQQRPAEVIKVYKGNTLIRPVYNGPELCFTANISNSTVQLIQQGSPTAVTLETSTDGVTWTTYTIGDTITLTDVGDKVYWRNTSETSTGFGTGSANYYRFNLTGSLNASGDVTSLINKDCTDTLVSQYSFARLFYNSSNSDVLKTSPKLSATNLTSYCYYQMFNRCTGLVTLPELPATTLTGGCYYQTFARCSGIKLSETQTGEYQTSYRIPTSGTGTTATNALYYTFMSTGGTWTGGTPTINTTYYTSNTVV